MPVIDGDGARVISVDPGLRSTGWALWHDRELVRCGAIRGGDGTDPDRSLRISNALRGMLPYGRLAIEVPRLRGRKEANPQDILRLAQLCGWIEGALWLSRPPLETEPRGWKGTIPKTRTLEDYVVHRRNLKAMEGRSLKQYNDGMSCGTAARMDVADAVGLGLWALEEW